VDNASSDGSAEMVKASFPQVRLIENQTNSGFAGANNLAVRQMSSKYVLLLNPDTLVKPDALNTLVDFMEDHPAAGAAGARLFNPDGTLQESCLPLPTLFREFWRLHHLDHIRPVGSYDMTKWPVNQPRQVDILYGACLMMRRELMCQIGLMDENYFMYTEEVDMCYRVRQAGYNLYWVPQAEVIHYGGQSTSQISEKMFIQLYLSKVQYFRKNHGKLASALYKVILMFAASHRLVLAPIAIFMDSERRKNTYFLSRQYLNLLVSVLGM
jgi:GT2 family glycosyltransferase